MDLEKKVNDNKPNILKRIVRRALPYVLVASLGLGMLGCKEAPGPISVQNTVSPTTVPSGSNIYLEVKVRNYGGEVTIEKATMHEKAISGWAVGYYDFSGDLPITNNKIPKNSTETIFSISAPLYNTPPSETPPNMFDVTFENTVTVSSDGGEDSDTCTYTVTSSYSSSSLSLKGEEESSRAVGGVVKRLSNYPK